MEMLGPTRGRDSGHASARLVTHLACSAREKSKGKEEEGLGVLHASGSWGSCPTLPHGELLASDLANGAAGEGRGPLWVSSLKVVRMWTWEGG
jgi:hypothetical protein